MATFIAMGEVLVSLYCTDGKERGIIIFIVIFMGKRKRKTREIMQC
jgi:hypothetical protein